MTITKESVKSALIYLVSLFTARTFLFFFIFLINLFTLFLFLALVLVERWLVKHDPQTFSSIMVDADQYLRSLDKENSTNSEPLISDKDADGLVRRMKEQRDGMKRVSYKPKGESSEGESFEQGADSKKEDSSEEKLKGKNDKQTSTSANSPESVPSSSSKDSRLKTFILSSTRRLTESSVMTAALLGGTPIALVLTRRYPRKKGFVFQLNLILLSQLVFIAYLLWKVPVEGFV